MSSVWTATAKAKPRDFLFPLKKTALLVQKMQREFVEVGGFGTLLGNDVAKLADIVPKTEALIEAARKAGVSVLFTKESHKADLSDVAPTKSKRTYNRSGKKVTIGDQGPLGRFLVDGEYGNEIVPQCAPIPGEKVFTAAVKGVYNTGLHEHCMDLGITHIIMAGVTTEIGVQLVMRELNDRGFDVCLVEDCTGSYFERFKEVSCEMIVAQGGIIGWTAQLEDILFALENQKKEEPPELPSWVPPAVPLLLGPDPPYPPPAPSAPLEADPEGKWITIKDAKPMPFTFPVNKTAAVVIDMQRDFILEGGFGSTLGNNVKLLQSIVPTVAFLLKTCREYNLPVIHTLEAHYPDLRDCPAAKLLRGGLPEGLRIGDKGDMGHILVRHEWGNEIVDENAPIPGEKVIHKPGKGAFFGTDLHQFLLEMGITHLLFAGVTTEVCVQTSMREATDRGFECLIVEDCTESYFPHFKSMTLEILTAQGAIVGWCATARQIKEALDGMLGSED